MTSPVIVDQAAPVGAKVLLVGDHHQLPEVAAGGGFRARSTSLGDRVVELTVNRRQHADVGTGSARSTPLRRRPAAFAAYQAHGRVVIDDDRHELRQRAIADWNTLRSDGATLMLAGTRAEAHLLNPLARQILADTGELDLERAVTIGGRSYAPGDHVILCRNHRGQHLAEGTEFAVDNGMRGHLTHIDAAGAHVTLTSGEEIVLDRDYLAAGWLDHGYASTIHTAQGVTCDSRPRRRPGRPLPRSGLRRHVTGPAVRMDLRHHRRGDSTSPNGTPPASRSPPNASETPSTT